ncbi:uncharacterized protein LOC122268180 isoform X2 [Penaeus japonicus]|uniref:uncharacterized protein LOC122268180 isoform X2 n=1 Tax=Penaeus japonicus TaxID=27405 RepID=UPI001C712AE3|nr:uncharacterized protein LOC122268180 isoform X2 [Penaeus japonicus]
MAHGRSPSKSPRRTSSRTHAALEGARPTRDRDAARDFRSRTQPQRHSRSRNEPHITGSLSSSSTPRPLLENHSVRETDEESNFHWMERRRGRNGDGENEENRRRMLRRRAEFEEEEEGLEKETLVTRICRAAKVVSGFLISMGLVLVFYVIITTIMGEKSPLDLFSFDLETDDLVERHGNFTEPTPPNPMAERDPGEGGGPGFPVRSLTIEGFGHAAGGAPVGGSDVAIAKAEGELLHYVEDDGTGYEDTHVEYPDATSDSNGTLPSDPEGRSYVAYIPVPLNNEEEEDYEDTEDDEERRPSNSNPVFVPVMIMPGGGAPGMGGMGPQFSVQNGRPPPPLHPGRRLPRPPFRQHPPRRPPPPLNAPAEPPLLGGRKTSRFPLAPAGLPPPPRMPLGSHSPNLRSPPLHTGANNRNDVMNINGGTNNMHNRFTNSDFYSAEGNMYNANQGVNNLPSMNQGMNSLNRMNNVNSGMSNTHSMNNVNSGITANRNMNNGNGANRNMNSGNTQTSGHTGQDIWNSLSDIMNRPNGRPHSPDTSSGRTGVPLPAGGIGPRVSPGNLPQAPARPPPMIAPRGPGRPLGPPPPLPPARRVRPRLLPRSRMSGPLPKPRPPRPHYRRPLLPPIPPPPGMPIVRRRQPRPAPPHRPPRDFQYPRDSGSIQDIIRYMRDKDQRRDESKDVRLPPGFSLGSQDHIIGHNSFKPNSGFTIGSQDHVIGDNPFGDTLGNINIQSQSDVGFGNTQQTGGDNFNNNNYNFNSGGESSFNNGGVNNFGGGGNGVPVSGGGGIPGFNRGSNRFNNGGNNFQNGGNFNNGGNNFQNGGNFNNGGNRFSNGGNDFNNGGSSNFNNGGGNFNNGGNNFNSGGGSGMSIIPPVQNTYDRGTSKSRPFNIMLDVYPMDDSPVTSGSRPFQTSISFNGGNGRFDSNNNGGSFNGGNVNSYDNVNNGNNGNRYSNNNGNSYSTNNENRYNNGDRFSNRDDANKHEVVLHLNLFSKSPLSIRRQGTADGIASGRSGAVSLELPLTGQLSPLDVYKAIINEARTSTAQAQVQHPPGTETDSRDEVEIELFDLEEGPRLLQAIEYGLQELNPSLPPDLRFIFDNSPSSASDLYQAVNGEDTDAASSASTPSYSEEMWPSPSWPAPEYDQNDDYNYYDYYEYEDYSMDVLDTETTTETTTITAETTSSSTKYEEAEQLPTPCWHSAEDAKHTDGAS